MKIGKAFTPIFLIMVIGAGCSAQKADDNPVKSANEFIGKLNSPVAGADINRAGISITSIEKSGDTYKIKWDISNSEIGTQNDEYIFRRLVVFDPQDYSKTFTAYKVDANGRLTLPVTTSANALTGNQPLPGLNFRSYETAIETKSNVAFLYFDGITGEGIPAGIVTPPVYFTVLLGGNPAVLEKDPRVAADVFQTYLPKHLEKK
jgi:hypothetical protein